MGKRSRRRGDRPDDPTGTVVAPEDAEPDADRAPEDGEAAPAAEPADGAPAPLSSDGRLHQAQLLIEEADHLGHLYRWIVLAGDVPRAQDWLRREDWPHPDDVIHVFGSWEKFLGHAHVAGSKLLARLRAAEEAERSVGAREQQLERELARVEDLRRQAETARRRREAAEAQRQEAQAHAERLAAQLERAESRAANAEQHLAERRREAQSAAPAADQAPDEWLAAHAALADELDAIRAHRDELLRTTEELREQVAQDHRTIARLSATLAEAPAAAAAARAADDATPPASVLEAVQRAEAGARALRFTPDARESAADSPYRRPA